MIGYQVTSSEFNRVVGEIARRFEAIALAVKDAKAVLDTKTSAQWASDTGLAQADVDTAISAINDLNAVVLAYEGGQALTQSDRRVFVRRCRGLSSLL